MADDYSDLAYLMGGVKRRDPFDAKRTFAASMLQQGMDASPARHPLQVAGRLAQALAGGWMYGKADQDEQAQVTKGKESLAAAMAEPDPQKRIALLGAANPDLAARLSGELAVKQATMNQQREQLQAGAGTFGSAYGGPQQAGGPAGGGGGPAAAIGGIEAPSYDTIHPVANAQGNRAHGKYGVMDFNIGPWTKEIVGQEMTPDQFRANPPAQDAVFKAKFGQYTQQFGSPEAAARAWFAGPGGMNNPNARDALGTSVADYSRKFTNAMGGQGAPPPDVVQPQGRPPQGSADGTPPQPSPQAVTGPAVIAPPGVPDVPRPKPTPQMIQMYQQRMMTGEFGQTPAQAIPAARAAMEAEIDRQWNVARDTAKMRYEQQYGDYKTDRKQAIEQPQQNTQNEAKAREQFDMLQSVKDYRKANTVFRSAVEASKVNSAAADLNMVYAFATLMDPGSVVRDSETQMVTATQNASDRIKALVATVSGGSRLSTEARGALINEMGSRYLAYKTAHDDLAGTFKGISERSGMNPQNVVVPYPEVEYKRGEPSGAVGASGPVKITGDEDYAKLPPGAQYIDPTGKTRTKGGR